MSTSRRRAFPEATRALLAAVIALSAVTGAARADEAGASVLTLPMIQILSAEDLPHRTVVNGFWIEALPGIRAINRGAPDFRDYVEAYRVVHPYFLRAASNRIEVRYRFERPPPRTYADSPHRIWHLKLRVAAVGEARDAETYHPTKLLRVLESPIFDASSPAGEERSLSGEFDWSEPLPIWRWTKGVVILPSPAEQASLYAAHQALFRELEALASSGEAGAAARDAVRARLLASTAEYRKACGLWRRTEPGKVKQEPVERLLEVATRLDTVADRPAYVYTPTKPRRGPQPLDTPVNGPDDPAAHGSSGGRPPRVSLAPLPDASTLRIELLAGGTLAHLVGTGQDQPLRYISNYHDGSWGAPRPTKYEADLWWRKNERGQWELDAVYPMHGAGSMFSDTRLERLREASSF